MKRISFLAFSVLSVILISSGCKKDVGLLPMDRGSYGRDVIGYDSIYVNAASWMQVTPTEFTYTYTSAQITQDAINTGNVHVAILYSSLHDYLSLNGNLVPFPATIANGVYFSVTYELNTATLRVNNVSGTSMPSLSYLITTANL